MSRGRGHATPGTGRQVNMDSSAAYLIPAGLCLVGIVVGLVGGSHVGELIGKKLGKPIAGMLAGAAVGGTLGCALMYLLTRWALALAVGWTGG